MAHNISQCLLNRSHSVVIICRHEKQQTVSHEGHIVLVRVRVRGLVVGWLFQIVIRSPNSYIGN